MSDPARETGERKRKKRRGSEGKPSSQRRRERSGASSGDAQPRGLDSAAAITVVPISGSAVESAEAIVVEPIRRGKRSPGDKKGRAADRGAPPDGATPALKAGSDEILFGKIALDCGYVDQKAIDHCVALQKSDEGKRFLGELLISEGKLGKSEVNEIIALQNKNLRKRYSFTGQPKENTLFGALVVAHGYATREQVNEAVRLQAEIERFDERLSLGELLVECGFLKENEVKEILALQKKREYRCYKCREVFTISLYEFGQKIRCPHCRKVLVLPETPESKRLKFRRTERRDLPVAIDEVEPLEESSLTDILVGSSASIEVESGPESSAPPIDIEKATGWYVGLGGKIFGPQKLDTLRTLIASDIFHRHDLFWHESMDDWQLAGEIPELVSLFPKPPPLPTGGGRPPSMEKDADVAAIVGRIEALHQKGAIGAGEYQEIRRLLLGD